MSSWVSKRLSSSTINMRIGSLFPLCLSLPETVLIET
jgi:hypothetical protein